MVELHEQYKDQGFEIVAFPSQQFGGQELKSAEDIMKFAEKKNAKFPIMAVTDVNGPKASPVWTYLKSACDNCGGDVRWNFAAKFIVDKDGKVVERNSNSPKASEQLIKSLL